MASLGLLLVIIPALAISVVVSVRAGLFNFSARPLSDAEIKALWAFAAATLASAATLVGTLFARQQAHATEERLTLDSAVASLKLITADGGQAYAPPAVIAGSMATLIKLGQPLLAIRTLWPAWQQDRIDVNSACWVISEVLKSGDADGEFEAATLLSAKHESLLGEAPGQIVWPMAIYDDWPIKLHYLDSHLTLIEAIGRTVLARPPSWWKDNETALGFFITSLWTLFQANPAHLVKCSCADMISAILTAYVNADDESLSITSKSQNVLVRVIRQRVEEFETPDETHSIGVLVRAILEAQ